MESCLTQVCLAFLDIKMLQTVVNGQYIKEVEAVLQGEQNCPCENG